MSDSLKLQGEVSLDTSGADAAFGRVEQGAGRMAQSVAKAGERAQRAVGGIGDGAEAGAARFDRAERNVIASIQRRTAAIEAAGKGERAYQEALISARGLDPAKFRPYLDALDKASSGSKAAAAEMTRMQLAAESLGNALGALGIAAVAAFGTAAVKSAVDLGDRLDDMAEKTGIAASELSVLRYAGEVAGTSFDAVATGISKLSQNMAKAAGGSKEQVAAFQAIGVSVKNLDGSLRGSDQVLGDLANRFSTFQDGPAKAALAMELFGKSGADMIPLLNKGANGIADLRSEAEKLGAVFSDELAASSAEFNDNLTRIGLSLEAARVQMIGQFVPTLNEVARAMVDAKSGSNSFAEALGGGFKTVLETVAILGVNVAFVLKGIGREIGAIAAQAVALATLDFDAFRAISDAVREDAERAKSELDALERRILGIQTLSAGAGRGAAPDPRALGPVASIAEQARAFRTDAPVVKSGPSEAEKAYESLINRVKERIAQQKQEIEVGRVLTEQEKFDVKTRTELAELMAKYPGLSKATVNGLLAESDARQQAIDRQKQWVKEAREVNKFLLDQDAELAADAKRRTDERDRVYKGIADQKRDLVDTNELLQAEVGLLGATDAARETALEQLRIELQLKRDIEAINQNLLLNEEQRAQAIKSATANADQAKAQASQRAFLNEWQRTTTSINDSLTDALLRGFESGKDFAENFRDTLKNMFSTLILRPVVQAALSPLTGALGGVTQSLFGSLGSGAVQGGISAALGGGGGLLGGLGGALGSFGGGLSTGLTGLSNSVGSLFGGSAAAMGGTTFGGALDAGFTALGAGNISGGLGTLAGSLGPIALVAAPIIGSLLKKGGAPKQGGYAGLIGPMGGDNSLGGSLQPIVQGYQQQLDSLVRSLGGSAVAQLGLGVVTDPKGTAPSFVRNAVTLNGQTVRDNINFDVGRDEASLQAAIQAQMKESLLIALKASDIQGALGDYIKSISDTSQIDAAIARVQKAVAEKQSLEDQLFDLTATDAQKLARSRDQQRASVDETNRALLEQVFRQQDLKRAADEAKAAMADLSRTLDSALSSYRTNAVSGIGRGEAFAQIQTALTIAQAGGPLPDLTKLKDAISVLSAPSEQAATSLREYVRQRDAEAALLEKLKTQYDVGGAAPAVSAAQAAANQAATTAATTAALRAMEKQLQDANDKLAAMARDAKTTAEVLDGAATGGLTLGMTDYTGSGA